MEDQPNVFLAPKPAQPGFSPKLGEIRQAFPLPGKYHFRFKSPLVPGSDRDKDCVPVWMDCVDDNQHVAVWRGGIFAKVTRISMDADASEERSFSGSNETTNGYKNVEIPAASVHSSISTTPVVSQHGAPAQVATEILLDVFDTPSVSSSTVSSNPSSVADPLSLFGGAPSAPVNGAVAEGSLLDMDAPVYSSAQPNSYSSSTHSDFLGMTVTATPANGAQVTNPPTLVRPMAPQTKLPPSRSGSTNAFDSFTQKSGPFGDLGWK
jgi:hypothetical protein